ncbi:MAG: thiamine pyrophosphate-dependent enzyme [Symbiobacteriaceae bacterium]|nr:thiamine pyrophosphate-dependent enzyme [Symbiobacteriaceae bacterium]
MTITEKLAALPDMISPGISSCVGCNVELILRTCMKVLGSETVLAIPPGCMGGVGVVGHNTKSGAKCPVFFPLLDNVASMLAGIKLQYERENRPVHAVAFAGDGATVDAGLQCLSGAAERGDRIIYICYDNEGYMNTGYQRSGSTGKYAWTSTTPVSAANRGGKRQHKKDIAQIMAMHDIPYLATCSPAYIPDMVSKVEKAMVYSQEGLVFLHILNPCVTGWGIRPDLSIQAARLSVQSNYHPLYEVVRGKYHLSMEFPEAKPLQEYLGLMRKYAHLTPEEIAELQAVTTSKWQRLKQLAAMGELS